MQWVFFVFFLIINSQVDKKLNIHPKNKKPIEALELTKCDDIVFFFFKALKPSSHSSVKKHNNL